MQENIRVRFGQLQTTMIAKGYAWFDNGDYNLNLVGIRTRDNRANTFNDRLAVAFRTVERPHLFVFDCTTDPGVYWREQPINLEGTAIVKPGQYRGLWQLGKHQGKYDALVQRGLVTVYRDNNKDAVLDMLYMPEERGHFGINCHRASAEGTSSTVNRWSAGCQVLANPDDFALLMALCRKAAALYGNSFTYTLLDEGDLWTP